MSKVVRGVKNITKGYTNVQVKVRNGMYEMLASFAERSLTLYFSNEQ